MTSEEIKKLASTGNKSDVGDQWEWISVADKLLWFECSDIYRRFRSGSLSAEDGKQETTRAIKEWESNKASMQRAYSVNERLAKLYKDIEVKASAFSRNPSIDTAQEMVEAIYGHVMKYNTDNDNDIKQEAV